MRATWMVLCLGLAACSSGDDSSPWTFYGFVAGEEATDTFLTARLDDTYVIAAGQRYLFTIDVSDPTDPKTVGVPVDLQYMAGLSVQGTKAYVVARHELHVIDFANPLAPVEIGVMLDAGVDSAYVTGTHAYCSNGPGGLKIIDVSNPAAMSIVGSVPVLDGDGGMLRTAVTAVKEPAVYVVASVTGGSDELRVIDASDVTHPVVTPFKKQGAYNAMISDNALMVGHMAGISAFNISTPLAPTLIAENERDATEHFQPIGLEGNRMFFRVGDATPGTTESSYGYVTYVFDVGNPGAAKFEGIVTRSGTHVMYEAPYLLFSGDAHTGLQVWGPPED